jgi:excinuclease ABC subunit B
VGIVKRVTDVMDVGYGSNFNQRQSHSDKVAEATKEYNGLSAKQLDKALKKLENKMYQHAQNLEFEDAAKTRDKIALVKEQYFTGDLAAN